jgi:hypothetical protein
MSSSEESKPGLCIASFGQSIAWAGVVLNSSLRLALFRQWRARLGISAADLEGGHESFGIRT